jgi:2',3'-cyclic-nucleotide 2'-phosphodiesterase (5'-nucleotidase family)
MDASSYPTILDIAAQVEGDYGRALGVVDIVIAIGRSVASKTARSLPVAGSPDLVPDPEIQAIADTIKAAPLRCWL